MQLLVKGQISVYLEKGEYEIVVNSITEDGLGQLYIALEQLKDKLSKEGLFNDEFKKPLPSIPKKIGVITASGGAAIKDIIKTIRHKSYNCQIYIFPSLVQGTGSIEEISHQIKVADDYNLDCLIVGRGGGSAEDLWSFNSEKVVRAVFDCKTPIISAVGHQKDSTLIDQVSDVCAHTPTDAANKIINQFLNSETKLLEFNSRLLNLSKAKFDENKNKFDMVLSKSLFKNTNLVYEPQKRDFEKLYDRFNSSSMMLIFDRKNSLSKIKQEYIIRHPCKMQLDTSKSNLKELKSRLIDVMEKILNNNKVNLDKTTNKFKFLSEKLVTSKSHDLEMSKSYLLTNPCQMQIDVSKNNLILLEDKLIGQINRCLRGNQKNLLLLKNNFKNSSNKIISSNSHKLGSIKNQRIIKNPKRVYESKYNDLNQVKNKNVIKNPYMILDFYKSDLDICREKLDKFNQVIELKKDQKRQKRNYIIIIVVIAVILIIVLLIMFGGIL